jgi:hypothetical protein
MSFSFDTRNAAPLVQFTYIGGYRGYVSQSECKTQHYCRDVADRLLAVMQ